MPTLLLLTHRWPYPPDKGDRIRAFGLLRELSRHFTIDLLSLCIDQPPPEYIQALAPFVRRCKVMGQGRWPAARGLPHALATGQSITERAFFRRDFDRTLAEWLDDRRYGAVLGVCSSVAAYMLRHPDTPLAVDFVDADSAKWSALAGCHHGLRRWLLAREARRLAELEGRLLARAQFSTAVSQVEADILRQRCPSARLIVAANGVDTGYFQPPGDPAAPKHVTFVGQMDYEPNVQAVVWLAKQVWPQVRRAMPACEFRIVGRQPAKPVQALQSIEGVHVIGAVPDVRPFLHDAISVAPLQVARGVQNKVLEAMACGMAVVASPPAVQGIELGARDAGETPAPLPLEVAETPEEWAASIGRLLNDPGHALALGREARQFVLEHYTWTTTLRPLIDELRSLTEQG